MLDARRRLGIRPSIFLANPIPVAHSLNKELIDTIISEAVRDADRSGITGHSNTPFILKRIRELTGGASIPANKALVEANVARGTRLAVALRGVEQRYSLTQPRKSREDN